LIYCYSVYGLSCISNDSISGFCLQPFISQNVDSDVVLDLVSPSPDWSEAVGILRRGNLCGKPISAHNADSGCTLTILDADDAFELSYADGTRFLIDGFARRVWGHCPPGFGRDFLATYVRGPVMGFILRQRGVTALHASALNFCGHAVLLCGQSQSGKSTLAAALALNGAPVLCEDVAALKYNGNALYVESGYPQVSLWPDAVEFLLGTSDALPRLTPSWEKCFLPLDGKRGEFDSTKRPVGVVYLLAPRIASNDLPRIEPISPSEALLALVQNTYMNWVLDRKQRAIEFEFLSKLVTHIPVRRIVPHSDPARIPALCELIVTDAKNYQQSQAFVLGG
jgi:hypothetical protein